MYDFGPLHFDSKADLLARSREFWNPGKTAFWSDSGVDLVLDRREGYLIWDMDGRRLIDAHLNGGTYNLGHRNPEVMAAVVDGMGRFDIGNHHFPSLARTALAEVLVRTAPPGLTKVAFASGGGEAIDIALKSARYATQRRTIVSTVKAYHGQRRDAAELGPTEGRDVAEPVLAQPRPGPLAEQHRGDGVDPAGQALARDENIGGERRAAAATDGET